MKRYILYIAAAASTVVMAAAAFLGTALFGSFAADGEEHVIFIAPTDDPDDVRAEIEAVGHGSRLTAFRLLAARGHYYDNIRPGRYDLGSGVSTLRVFRNLRNGTESPVRLTIPNVRTTKDLAKFLGKKLMPSAGEFEAALQDTALLSRYGLKRETAICLFVANTYEIYWDTTPEHLMERMHREYEDFWTKKRTGKLEGIDEGFSREQAITLASIVESETANSAERPTVAGLYINRLHRGIKLQADPTVKFAVGDFSLRRIMNRHLRVESPYNTYRVEGLPPGPICIPSVESIDAVLDYDHHDYIYMCAKEDFSGSHNFAANDAEHMENARKYQQALNARGIK